MIRNSNPLTRPPSDYSYPKHAFGLHDLGLPNLTRAGRRFLGRVGRGGTGRLGVARPTGGGEADWG